MAGRDATAGTDSRRGADRAAFDGAVALQKQGRHAEAEAAYRSLLEAEPDHAQALNNLGVLLRRAGRHAEAGAAFRQALAARPDYHEALCNLAHAHRFVPGDPLIAALKRELARQPRGSRERSHVLVALGKAHDDMGDYDAAFGYYRRANEGLARQVRFDPSLTRRRIAAIKAAFPRPLPAPDRAPAAVTPVFVVGMPRSGKTLVESLLAQHPSVIAAGEVRQWQAALDGVRRDSGIAEPFPACVPRLGPLQIREVGARYLRDALGGRLLPGTRFHVNTLPGNYLQLGLIFSAFPAVRVIYCRRDPLDQCLFTYFKIFEEGHEYAFDLGHLGAYFRCYREMMAHWQALFGDRILAIRYETLVRAPAETAREIYAHCGIGFRPEAVKIRFTAGEIGHAQHYLRHLDPLREALGV